MKRFFLGESALCWSLGNEITAHCSAKILHVYRVLKDSAHLAALGVRDVVPAYHSIAVYFDPVSAPVQEIEAYVQQVLDAADSGIVQAVGKEVGKEDVGKEVVLPVQYDGVDLEEVARHNGLSVQDVIHLHSHGKYTVAMIGFLPHFAYLMGLDRRLATPRLDKPRSHVPAGSVAIGGNQTAVYPSASPGGWRLIGVTDPTLLCALAPGDQVFFKES